jgi:hypothetical protein
MARPIMHILICSVFATQACRKTVVSDKVVPVAIATATAEPLKKGIGDGIPDTKAVLRLTNASCEAERQTVFSVKVAGLINTDWIKLSCNDKSKEIVINTKKGYCNVLQLKADVSFSKAGLNPESYTRSTSVASDLSFFKIDQTAARNENRAGTNIHFEDINDDYWNNAYMICLKDKNKIITKEPITGLENQPCSNILSGYTNSKNEKIDPVVEWNDFEFTVESDDVQFTVEGFKDFGCRAD